MTEPTAYLNGKFIPLSSATIAVYDAGFVLGATVSEQLRTFGGALFRLDDHLARLTRSLEVVGTQLPMSVGELANAAKELVACNYMLLAKGDDLGLSMFVTPGPYATLAGPNVPTGTTVGLHTYPLPFQLWRDKYASGEVLVTPRTRQVPSECWPTEIKCRSRMHYHLADREARAIDPRARALMLDLAGNALETSTANLLIYKQGEGLVSPPHSAVLPGISLAVTLELAAAARIAHRQRALSVEDVQTADEVLLTSTPNCILPATMLNGKKIGDGGPGPIFGRLLSAWNKVAGFDIAEQARRFAAR